MFDKLKEAGQGLKEAAQGAADAAKGRVEQAQEAHRLLKDGGEAMATKLMAKKAVQDLIEAEKKFVPSIEAMIATLQETAKDMREAEKLPVGADYSEEEQAEFKKAAEVCESRVKALQSALSDLQKGPLELAKLPEPLGFSPAEQDAFAILLAQGAFKGAKDKVAGGVEAVQNKVAETKGAGGGGYAGGAEAAPQ